MNTIVKAAAIVITAFGSSVQASSATTFAAWKVTDLAFGDTLNVRKYPASSSQKQAAYPAGTTLQMTGRCTNGVNLLDIAGQPRSQQRKAVRYTWCEIWHDPARNEQFTTGWVYGRYIAPE